MSSLPTTDQLLNAIPRQAYYQNLQGYNYLALQLPPPPPDLILQTCLRSGRLAVPLIQHFRIRSQCHAARMLICAGHCHWISVRYFSLLEKMDRLSLFDDVYNWIGDITRTVRSSMLERHPGIVIRSSLVVSLQQLNCGRVSHDNVIIKFDVMIPACDTVHCLEWRVLKCRGKKLY